jgi:hypothetical protein
MGTRSTYRIIEKHADYETPICMVYMQYDGYPTGHPTEVANWLAESRVVNGFNSSDTGLVFNGAGCLAARLISFLKKDAIGNCYMESLDSRGNCGEDYMYDVIVDCSKEFKIIMTAYDSDGCELFSGSPKAFANNYSNQKV